MTLQQTLQRMKPSAAAGMPAAHSHPSKAQADVRHWAIRDFCQSVTHRRTLLTKSDFARCFPTLFQAGLPGGYYVDATGPQPILGHVRVDVGLDEVGRIVHRCHQLARRHQQLTGFRPLIAAGQFEITYLVATQEKARRLLLAFESVAMTGVRCVAVPLPNLLDRLAPLPAT